MNTRLILAFRQAFSQIRRNLAMSFASLFSITAIMIVLGVFFILIVNVNNIAESVKQDFDTIQLYLDADVTEEQAEDLMDDIKGMDNVETVTYLDKNDAMERWKKKWGDNANLLDRLKTNPLPNSIIIQVLRLEDANSVYNATKDMTGVEDVSYYQDTVEKLVTITDAIQVGAIVIIVFMIIISIVVVSNTIKLTVIARGKEIMIMKYIGATNWFVRAPFLLEGVLIGIVSALISGGLITYLYDFIVKNYGVDIALLVSTGLVPEMFLVKNLFIIFIALGTSIGACGSVISMRRFLDN
ncbi:MAG: permease-like cell division protein FtsX [Clostridiales Family XIII bacterium]|jgi:cell division transport system permease protein|nr:permease-like cell division protein FtsX [Clostridiales Family XIII bacterium]